MEVKVIDNYSDLFAIEHLRCDAFNIPKDVSEFYMDRFKKHAMLFLGAYIGDELVGGLYFSSCLFNCGSIDMLFVKPEYQNTDYHIGTYLLNYVEEHNQDLCDYLDCISIEKYLISPASECSERLYKHRGYKQTGLDGTYYKRIK